MKFLKIGFYYSMYWDWEQFNNYMLNFYYTTIGSSNINGISMYCLLLFVLLITPMLRLVIICLISCSIYPNPCFRWAKTSLTFKLLQQISLHKDYGTTTQLKSFENDWPSNCRINKLQVSWLILCDGKFREKSSRYVILVCSTCKGRHFKSV